MPSELLLPSSAEEAIEAFSDGAGIRVVGGGTIVIPEVAGGGALPDRVLMLHRAGLAGVSRENGTVTIGAGTPIAALEDGDGLLATVARNIADPEIRGQATVGGNICASARARAPRRRSATCRRR